LPHSTIADEFIYSDFAILIKDAIPLFDIHPPLVRMLFSAILTPFHYSHQLFIGEITNYNGFPFQMLRFFVAAFGIMLPILLYLIGRLSHLTPRWALLIGLFAICDNALTLYGATILPDTILVFFSMAALASTLIAAQTKSESLSWSFTILGSLLWGCALGTKWTALGMLFVFLFVLAGVKKNNWYKFIVFCGLSVAVYVALFSFYFTLFKQSNLAPATILPSTITAIQETRFPDPTKFTDIINYLPKIHEVMLHVSSDAPLTHLFVVRPRPYIWLIGQSTIIYWWSTTDQHRIIYLMGNFVLWPSLFLLFIFLLYDVVKKLTAKGWDALTGNQLVLVFMIGYLSNYLPFFFITRPTYLYHYFTALLFLLLLAPHTIKKIMNNIEQKTHDPFVAQLSLVFFVIVIITAYLIALPITYGW
jgi:dolichyl-phosphate-mannose--protein O-mannosyl transferase